MTIQTTIDELKADIDFLQSELRAANCFSTDVSQIEAELSVAEAAFENAVWRRTVAQRKARKAR